MDLHNKLTLAHAAWFDKEIAKEPTPVNKELEPLSWNDELIIGIYNQANTTNCKNLNDVLFDSDVIGYKEWRAKNAG